MSELEEGSWSVFGIPRSHWHCQLSNFDWDGVKPASLQTHVLAFLEGVAARQSPHLILTGEPGIGKSHLGVACYRQAVKLLGTQLSTWVNIPMFCDKVKNTYGSGADPYEEYKEARVLVVLDDLFGRELSSHEIGQIVYRLIDIAYMNGAAVLINMNQDIKEAQTYLKPHEVSRVLADSTIIPMKSTRDWRRGL